MVVERPAKHAQHSRDKGQRLTAPMFLSIVDIRLFASFLSSLLLTSFSSASTTPSLHLMPMAVPPFSTALTAYSTCLSFSQRPAEAKGSGEPGSFGRLARRRNWTGRSPCLSTSAMGSVPRRRGAGTS